MIKNTNFIENLETKNNFVIITSSDIVKENYKWYEKTFGFKDPNYSSPRRQISEIQKIDNWIVANEKDSKFIQEYQEIIDEGAYYDPNYIKNIFSKDATKKIRFIENDNNDPILYEALKNIEIKKSGIYRSWHNRKIWFWFSFLLSLVIFIITVAVVAGFDFIGQIIIDKNTHNSFGSINIFKTVTCFIIILISLLVFINSTSQLIFTYLNPLPNFAIYTLYEYLYIANSINKLIYNKQMMDLKAKELKE